jgi:hypothetical protein
MFGMSAANCKDDGGRFEASDSACYYENAEGNTLDIEKHAAGPMTVSISVVYGPANMRDFHGAVVSRIGNTLKVVETDSDITSKACKMIVKVIRHKVQVTPDYDKCDSNLGRIDGATKK